MCTSTEASPIPLDLRSKDSEARIAVSPNVREHLIFSPPTNMDEESSVLSAPTSKYGVYVFFLQHAPNITGMEGW